MEGVINKARISTLELEKHLDDYRKGRALNSKKTADLLPSASFSSSLELSELSPTAGLNYSLYRTAMTTYSSRARYVRNIDEALPHIKKILQQA